MRISKTKRPTIVFKVIQIESRRMNWMDEERF